MNHQPSIDLDASLIKIAKGTGLAFLGTLAGLLLLFLGRILVARLGTESDYGIFSLAFVILNFCAIIATLGFDQGIPRTIAFAREKGNNKIGNIIPTSIQLCILTSTALGVLVFFIAPFVSSDIFDESDLVLPLRIIALTIPFFTVINILISIFRGFDDICPKVYFQDILRNLLFIFLLLPVFLLKTPFASVFASLLFSFVISCFAITLFASKRLPHSIWFGVSFRIRPEFRQLLIFSLPLFGVTMLQMIMIYIDTIMLGIFDTSQEVGLYNVAAPMARFISSPLEALVLIFMPITTALYARGATGEIRKTFSIVTKWLFLVTMPLFLTLFLFPDEIIYFTFGDDYTTAANALRILSIGFIINNLMGPNQVTLIAIGQPRFVLWVTLATAIFNIILNAILIPRYGVEGAAIASVASITSIHLLRCWRLYSLEGIQPITRNLLKVGSISLLLILAFHVVIASSITVKIWMVPIFFMFYYVISGTVILVTKSIDQEEIDLIHTVTGKFSKFVKDNT